VEGVTRRFLASYGELVLVLGLGVLAQAELWLDPTWAADRYALAPVALGMTAVLLLRLRAPLATLVLEIVGLQVAHFVNGVDNDDPMTLILLALVAIYSAGAHTRGRSLLAAVAVVVVTTVVSAYQDGSSMNVSGILFFAFWIGGPFLAGFVIRVRRERERLLVSERDERARAAVAEERTRIARELHDVVAHAISVIVLQARGARHAEGAERDEALDAIEATAATALTEMRRLLHMLRADDEDVLMAPQPSLTQLEQLAAQVRDAGLPVELQIHGEPRELPPGVDVSAYRIVQEALTNALKHAGTAHARVSVTFSPDALELVIADSGAGTTNGGGSGHGLLGMRERVAAFGGELASGPAPEGGYAVRARLPL
jgi:signal transduction histidine kinase